jgi:hypothetical protein
VVVHICDALQQRGAEGERLAGAGARLPDQVDSGQGQRDGLCLDGERGGDSNGLEGLGGLGRNPEIGKRRQFKPLTVRRQSGTWCQPPPVMYGSSLARRHP